MCIEDQSNWTARKGAGAHSMNQVGSAYLGPSHLSHLYLS